MNPTTTFPPSPMPPPGSDGHTFNGGFGSVSFQPEQHQEPPPFELTPLEHKTLSAEFALALGLHLVALGRIAQFLWKTGQSGGGNPFALLLLKRDTVAASMAVLLVQWPVCALLLAPFELYSVVGLVVQRWFQQHTELTFSSNAAIGGGGGAEGFWDPSMTSNNPPPVPAVNFAASNPTLVFVLALPGFLAMSLIPVSVLFVTLDRIVVTRLSANYTEDFRRRMFWVHLGVIATCFLANLGGFLWAFLKNNHSLQECTIFECLLGQFSGVYFGYRSLFAIVNSVCGAVFFVTLYRTNKSYCDTYGCTIAKRKANRINNMITGTAVVCEFLLNFAPHITLLALETVYGWEATTKAGPVSECLNALESLIFIVIYSRVLGAKATRRAGAAAAGGGNNKNAVHPTQAPMRRITMAPPPPPKTVHREAAAINKGDLLEASVVVVIHHHHQQQQNQIPPIPGASDAVQKPGIPGDREELPGAAMETAPKRPPSPRLPWRPFTRQAITPDGYDGKGTGQIGVPGIRKSTHPEALKPPGSVRFALLDAVRLSRSADHSDQMSRILSRCSGAETSKEKETK